MTQMTIQVNENGALPFDNPDPAQATVRLGRQGRALQPCCSTYRWALYWPRADLLQLAGAL